MTIRPHSCYRQIGTKSTLIKGDRWPGLLGDNLNLDIVFKPYIVKANGQWR